MATLKPGRMFEDHDVKGKVCRIPNALGIYRHVDKVTGNVDYVGQSDNLRQRQQQHVQNGKLNLDTHKVAWKSLDNGSKDDLCRTEVDHIARHNPGGNSTRGGNGRR